MLGLSWPSWGYLDTPPRNPESNFDSGFNVGILRGYVGSSWSYVGPSWSSVGPSGVYVGPTWGYGGAS
eukprot:9010845-Karenia_brevis.AAC.1